MVREVGIEIDLHFGSEIAFRFNMPEVAAWPPGHLADGRFGRRAQDTVEMMLERGWPDFIGSAAHDLEKRSFLLLKEARERVLKLYSEAEVDRLFHRSPAERRRSNNSPRRGGSGKRRKKEKAGFFQRLLWR